MFGLNDIETINLDGIQIEIKRSAKRKTLNIEVGNKGVIARAPLRMRFKTIEQFIVSKQDWIKRHVSTLKPPTPPLELKDGVELMYQGVIYYLSISHGQRRKVQLNEHSNTINVPIMNSHLSVHERSRTKLIKWYKQVALDQIERRVDHFSALMQLQGSVSKVRDYKRRWGSCDHKGQLSFNWRIIMAPPEVLDYVVVHELAHCIEFNHSKRFWSIVESFLPNWKDQRDWLNTNGSHLYRF